MVSSWTSVLASLLFGKLSNIISNTKFPIMVGVALITIGNLVMAFAHRCSGGTKWVVFTAKALISFGMGVQSNMNAYLAMGSKMTERNQIMSYRAEIISFATILGSCLQMAYSMVGYPGVVLGPLWVDMYTLPGFTFAFLGCILLVLIKLFFVESWISVYKDTAKISVLKRGNRQQAEKFGENVKEYEHLLLQHHFKRFDNSLVINPLRPMDRVAASVTIFILFVCKSCGSAFRAIAPPLTMLMFNWSPKQVLFYNSLASMVSYIGRAFTELYMPFIMKFIKEQLMMVISCLLLTIFFLIYLPWANQLPFLADTKLGKFQNSTDLPQLDHFVQALYGRKHTFSPNDSIVNSASNIKNYPSNDMSVLCFRKWCKDITKISIFQFFAGYLVLHGLAIPIGSLSTATLITKIPGPRKQGTIQGVYHAAGQLAASLAPLFATTVFQFFGPKPVWGLGFEILIVAFAITIGFFRRLLPWADYDYAVRRQACSGGNFEEAREI